MSGNPTTSTTIKLPRVDDIRMLDLPKIHDRRGNISFVEGGDQIPFEIERAYWIYDVPGGEVRGAHAFHDVDEFIIALSGSFDVILDDGQKKSVHSLNRSYHGLFVPAMTWRTMENFSTNSLCLVLASRPFEVDSYIIDYDTFLKEIKGREIDD